MRVAVSTRFQHAFNTTLTVVVAASTSLQLVFSLGVEAENGDFLTQINQF